MEIVNEGGFLNIVYAFLCRNIPAQNPSLQQYSALDAEFLGHLDRCVSANL